MPFTSLLLTALASNRLVKENGVGVAIRQDKNDNEVFLLFSSDKCDFFHNGYLKRILSTKNEPSCCDAICFAQVMENENPKITICFIELKAGGSSADISKAVDQIAQTYEGVKKGIEETHEIDTQKLKIIWKALIITSSSLPNKDIDQSLQRLRKMNINPRHASMSEIVELTSFIKKNRIVSTKNSHHNERGSKVVKDKEGMIPHN